MPQNVMPQNAVAVLTAGGSLVLKQVVMPDALNQLAAAAHRGGGHVTIIAQQVYMPDVMATAGRHGPGHITFDLSQVEI